MRKGGSTLAKVTTFQPPATSQLSKNSTEMVKMCRQGTNVFAVSLGRKLDRKFFLARLGQGCMGWFRQTRLTAKMSNTIFDRCVHWLLFVWLCSLFPQSYCDDPDLVLELKNLIVIFADTLQVGLKRTSSTLNRTECATKKDWLSVCVFLFTGLWLPSESSVWPAVWGQRPV